MRRRHRRLLNLVAFTLLAIAVYLNMFRMHDDDEIKSNKFFVVKTEQKPVVQANLPSKTLPRQQHKN